MNLIEEFLAAPLWVQVVFAVSILLPIVAMFVLGFFADRYEKAVDKYGESVLKSHRRLRKK